MRRLEESAFDPSDVGGLGRMTFDQCALREFIDLLKQYSYEEKSVEQQ